MHAVFSCVHISNCDEAYSFTTDGYGIFNMRTNLGAFRTQERGCGRQGGGEGEGEGEGFRHK